MLREGKDKRSIHLLILVFYQFEWHSGSIPAMLK
jgi:hypothetical protein